MGSNEFDDAMPVHAVTVNSFYMDVHEVTNAEFAEFVNATNYITVAEQKIQRLKIIRMCLQINWFPVPQFLHRLLILFL